jgi:metal-sulfur cluster biosynthetic enzyme
MVDSLAVREALRDVIDPELGINIVDLGLLRGIENRSGEVTVSMVLTTMSCPFWGLFVDQVQTALADVKGVDTVNVKLDPRRPWAPDDLSESARDELVTMGLLPLFDDLPAPSGPDAGRPG